MLNRSWGLQGPLTFYIWEEGKSRNNCKYEQRRMECTWNGSAANIRPKKSLTAQFEELNASKGEFLSLLKNVEIWFPSIRTKCSDSANILDITFKESTQGMKQQHQHL